MRLRSLSGSHPAHSGVAGPLSSTAGCLAARAVPGRAHRIPALVADTLVRPSAERPGAGRVSCAFLYAISTDSSRQIHVIYACGVRRSVAWMCGESRWPWLTWATHLLATSCPSGVPFVAGGRQSATGVEDVSDKVALLSEVQRQGVPGPGGRSCLGGMPAVRLGARADIHRDLQPFGVPYCPDAGPVPSGPGPGRADEGGPVAAGCAHP